MDIYKWTIDIHNRIMGNHNCILDIQCRFMDIYNLVMYLHDWLYVCAWLEGIYAFAFSLSTFVGFGAL